MVFLNANKVIVLVLFTFVASCTHGHHYISETYDDMTVEELDVVVLEFRFINPHPFIVAEIWIDSISAGESSERVPRALQLEMDNRWELAELGFDSETFMPGDRLRIAANPSVFDSDRFYLRVIEHPRLQFRYEHNQRQLFEILDGSLKSQSSN